MRPTLSCLATSIVRSAWDFRKYWDLEENKSTYGLESKPNRTNLQSDLPTSALKRPTQQQEQQQSRSFEIYAHRMMEIKIVVNCI